MSKGVGEAFTVIAFAGRLLKNSEDSVASLELSLMSHNTLSGLFDELADSDLGESAEVSDLYTLLALHREDDEIGIIDFDPPKLEIRTVSWILEQESWELVGYLMFPLSQRPKWLFWSPVELPTYGYRMYIPRI